MSALKSYFGIFSLILGVVFGIVITLQLNRLYSTQQIATDKSLLLEEKSLLLQRLGEIDRELQLQQLKPLVNTQASIVVDFKNNDSLSNNNKSNVIPSNCPFTFKLYIYPIPSSIDSIRISEEARKNNTLHVCQKCILEQFSLEYIVLDYFSNHCTRTNNPEEADFFYLPIVRDAEFRIALERGGRSRAPSPSEQALLELLEKNDSRKWNEVFQVTDTYWKRNNGGDHIIVMPAPVTNLRHESSQRGYFHYMMHLHAPIFLNLEYSIDFVREYPVCSTLKNIVMPYPTTDPDLFNGKLLNASSTIPRTALLYYAGGMHGDCIEVRKAMKVLMTNSSKLINIVPHIKSIQAEREHGFLAATFCPIPSGDSPSSKRMYDVLNFGCIPVTLSDDLIWAYSDQSGGRINHSDFSIQIPQSVVHFTSHKTLTKYAANKAALGTLPSGVLVYDLLKQSVDAGGDFSKEGHFVNPLVQILSRVSQKDIKLLQEGVIRAAPHYRYYQLNNQLKFIPTSQHVVPDGGASIMLAELLQKRKEYGLVKLRHGCQAEKNSKNHKYVSRYSCDSSDKTDSLVRRTRYKFR